MSKDVSTIPKRARNVSFRSLYRRDNADDPIPRQASRPAFTHKHGAKQPPLTHLSQWHVCEFADAAGHKFLSVVRWMMWRKVGVSGDAVAADAILSAAYSLTQKTLGHPVQGSTRLRGTPFRIIEEGNYLKFSQNPALRDNLLMREDADLVEVARMDRLRAPGFGSPSAWWDQGLLCKVLVSVRDQLRKEDAERARAHVHHAGSERNANQKNHKGFSSHLFPPRSKFSGKRGISVKSRSMPTSMPEMADAPRAASQIDEEPVRLTSLPSRRQRAFAIAEAYEKLSDRELVAAQLVFDDMRNVDKFLEYPERREKARILFLKLKIKEAIHQVPDESDED